MVIGDVAAAGSLLLQLADAIQRLGNNYYRSTDAWSDFPRQLVLLQGKHSNLKAALERYGLLDDLNLPGLELLKHATEAMQKEEDRLREREGGSGCKLRITMCLHHTKYMLFPEQVGSAIRNAITAYDGIEEYLKSQKHIDQLARDVRSIQPLGLPFHQSPNYVQLGCESAVHLALMRSRQASSPTVVLLHGGPGRGKSTLVRQLCAIYEADREKPNFTQICFLECGPDASTEAKEMELLQQLGLEDYSDLSQIQSHANSIPRRRKLQNLLKNPKLLVVLDDVCEAKFLQNFLNLSAPVVKFLVTSQRRNLLSELDCSLESSKSIEITDLQQDIDAAKKMLAVHSGFSDQQLSQLSQEVVNDILHQTEGVPLIIAIIGAQLQHTSEVAENVEMCNYHLQKCLQYLQEKTPAKLIGGIAYSGTYWSAIQRSIDKLGEREKHLLFSVCMFRDSSISQVVVQVFCTLTLSQVCDKWEFQRWKTALINANLLSVKESDTIALSVHSMTKKLIDKCMEDELTSILHSLVYVAPCRVVGVQPSNQEVSVASEETKVMMVLVCLYLDSRFSEGLASQIDLTSASLSEIKRRVNVVEPLIQLLGFHGTSSSNSGELQIFARQVFLKFIYKNTLDHDHILLLLGSGLSDAIMGTLKFLQLAALLETPFWQNNRIGNISGILLRLFQGAAHLQIQIAAAWTLFELLACNAQSRSDIASTPGLLQYLLQSLSNKNADIQLSACRVVGRVLYALVEHSEAHHPLMYIVDSFPNILEVLRLLLSNDQMPGLQAHAAAALSNFACAGQSAKQRILNVPGLLDDLIKLMGQDHLADFAVSVIFNLTNMDASYKLKLICAPNLLDRLQLSLSKHNNPNLQEQAAAALVNLAGGSKVAADKILNVPRLLDDFVKAMRQGERPALAAHAAAALANLCAFSKLATEKILNVPRLLDDLVMAMHQHDNSALAVQAAKVIANLAATNDPSVKLRVVCIQNLLDGLQASLSKDGNPALQQLAATALTNLADSQDQLVKEKILNVQGLLDDLVQTMHQDQNSGLAEQAAHVICGLAATNDRDLQLKIVCVKNLLDSLQLSLSKDSNLALQEKAAAALANLAACGGQFSKQKILSVPGLLDDLIKLIGQDQKPYLAELAVIVIANLAYSDNPSFKPRIVCTEHVLDSLQASLSMKGNPGLQVRAAQALANLADGCGQSSKLEIILNVPRLLDDLVKAMGQDENPTLGTQAAQVIRNLAATDILDFKLKIVCAQNLIDGLQASLSKNSNPGLQQHAAGALANLAYGRDQSVTEKLLNVRGLLDDLVKIMYQNQNSRLAEHAAHALFGLTATSNLDLQLKIVCTKNLLDSLQLSLSKDGYPGLQVRAAATLANLAAFGGQSFKQKILNFSGLLDDLIKAMGQNHLAEITARVILYLTDMDISFKVKLVCVPDLLDTLQLSLSKHDNPNLQETAAAALTNLSAGGELATQQILNVPRLLDDLIKTMGQDKNPCLGAEAARVISILTATDTLDFKLKIVCAQNLLDSLQASLSKNSNPALQEHAAGALANLAYGCDQSVTEKLLNVRGLLDDLVKTMCQNQNSGLAEEAARVIRCLAATKNLELQLKIVCIENLLDSLQLSLSKDGNPDLQEHAAAALANLANGAPFSKQKIRSMPGLLDYLIKLMGQNKSYILAREAARVIANLVSSDDPSFLHRLVCFPELLDSLQVSLSMIENPGLQVNGAAILGNLALGDQYAKEKIFNVSLLLDDLIKAMRQNQNPTLAHGAARVIKNLAEAEDPSFKLKIACVHFLLDTLQVSLSKHGNPGLQETAAAALANLVATSKVASEKILNVPGLLDDLIIAMGQNENPCLAAHAAGTIRNLAAASDANMKTKMLGVQSHLVESLEACLSIKENPVLQRQATEALNVLGHASAA